MSDIPEMIRKAKEDVSKIENRVRESILLLNSVTFKSKPGPGDIDTIKQAVKLLKGIV